MAERVELPAQEYLEEELRYDVKTGLLWWRKPKRARKMYKPAGNTTCAGYTAICLDYQSYQAHRVVWKILYDEEPDEIDHIDGDKQNNRVENLRAVPKWINALNMKDRDNRELPRGVHVDKNNFAAKIRINGVNVHLGNFATAEEASEAYQAKWSECLEGAY